MVASSPDMSMYAAFFAFPDPRAAGPVTLSVWQTSGSCTASMSPPHIVVRQASRGGTDRWADQESFTAPVNETRPCWYNRHPANVLGRNAVMAEANGIESSPTVIDLFCGAGGLSYGLKLAGLDIVAGIDVDPACKHPFESNVGSKFYETDLSQAKPEWIASLYPEGSIRILAGCAPCQPFSTYSQRYAERDGSWALLAKFSSLIERVRPEIVTMENVPSLMKHPNFQDFLGVLHESGYHRPSYRIVACAGYGVPQTRRRLVLLASTLGDIRLMPPTHSRSEYPVVRDFIGDQEEITVGSGSSTDPLHRCSGLTDRNLQRIRHSKQGGTWRDWPKELRAACHTIESGRTYTGVYGRMKWDAPGPTITTQFNGFGNGRFGHPEQDRAISLREGALLQTFPKEYSFVQEGETVFVSQVARLIGNAVPVRLAEAIGRSIIGHLENPDVATAQSTAPNTQLPYVQDELA